MFSKSHRAQGKLISHPLPVLFLLLRKFSHLNGFVQMVPSVFFRDKSVKVSTGQSHPRVGVFLILKQEPLLASNYCPLTWERLKVILFGE